MGRIYAVPFNGTVTAAGGDTDLWSFQPASNKPILLRGFTLGQTTEFGDAQEEEMRITVKLLPATFTVGSGGSSVTAKSPQNSTLDPTWGFTARTNDTTVATSSGTVEIKGEFGWNERNTPCDYWWPDAAFCPGAFNGQGLVIRNETTLADDLTFSGVAYVEEMG